MSSMIPYTQAAFNKIANNSIQMHNNRIENNAYKMNYMGVMNDNAGIGFVSSFINDLDIFIQSVLYDADIRTKVKNYVDRQMSRYGQYIDKGIMSHIHNLDMKYVSVFKEHGFLEGIFVPYIYENVMITD